jgi:hypothetical protein
LHPGNDAPNGDAPAETDNRQPQQQTRGDERQTSRVVQVPEKALGRIKREEREKGERRAREALDAEAKALGFSSMEDMKRAASEAKKGRQEPRGQQPARTETQDRQAQPQTNGQGQGGGVSRREYERLQRENQDLQEKLRVATRDKMRAEKRQRITAKEALEEQARLELKVEAVMEGIKDPDYAVELVRRKVPQQAEGETTKAYYDRLSAIDQKKMFGELRESHPYLFGEVVRPASTGNGGAITTDKAPGAATKPQNAGSPPPPPAPGTNGKSARDWTTEQLNKNLTDMGIDPAVLT